MNTKLFVTGIVVAAFIAGLLNTPVPETLGEPWKYRLVIAERKIIQLAAGVQSFVTSKSYTASVRQLRHQSSSFFSLFNSVESKTTNATYTTFDGVSVLVYTPLSKSKHLQPAFIYIHGGGKAYGSIALYEGLTRQFAERLQIPVVSVEYRLSPENPMLSDFEDCLKATVWFMKHSRKFGVDNKRIAIGGDSAGGSLSAAVSQHVHDQTDLPDLAFQVLLYPNTQVIDLHLPSHQIYRHHFKEGGFLSVHAIAIFAGLYFKQSYDKPFVKTMTASNHTIPALKAHPEWKKCLDHELVPKELRNPKYYTPWKADETGNDAFWDTYGNLIQDVRTNPGLREDLKNLPPAFVATCDLDSLRDDGIIYAKRLETAGVPVKLINYEGAFHAITWLGGLSHVMEFATGKQMINDIVAHIRETLKINQ
ncbi:arylacetamide deacetylase-like [Amphiura filiformis]|uniref:arylacetamide deacetylase-like n=1 Tax=Amphiura filiformis TaxID=82378 RepID=UPI003B225DA3